MKITFSKKEKARLHTDYKKALVNLVRFINRHQPLIMEKMNIEPREIVLLERSLSREIVDTYGRKFPIIFKAKATPRDENNTNT